MSAALSRSNAAAYCARMSLQATDVMGLPGCRWRIAHAWQGAENQLARYSSPDLPSDVDKAGFDTILLQPGDMLYMPRGEQCDDAAMQLRCGCLPLLKASAEDLLRLL